MSYKNWPDNKPIPKNYTVEDGWVLPKDYVEFMPPKGFLEQLKSEVGQATIYLTDGQVWNLTTHHIEDE